MSDRILEPGRNCWKLARADRVAFLVDGAAYFDALASAIERAERSILLVGWDFHSRVRLRADARERDAGSDLTTLLDAAVARDERLSVRVLDWDFVMLYALEREALPLLRFAFQTDRRVRFRLDDEHPTGGSQHQKLAVIDDRIAFCGGLDVTACRWDTPEHAADDPRRSDPGFPHYAPFHDVQMLVDGQAARALGELVRERWRRATGERVAAERGAGDPWPPGVEARLRDVDVGIARTLPAHGDQREVREVERLYVDALRAARRHVYIENQYFTSKVVGDAIVERLREEDGPEVVLVGPEHCPGWLEEGTMGVLRARLLRRLGEADRFGRLRAYHPVVPGLKEQSLQVHAKVMVVDDCFARVGSANLANRSMGLDSECDLGVESRGDAAVERGIARLRDELLAEHLGVAPERVEAALAEHGSLVAAVEALRGGARTLAEIDAEVDEVVDQLVPEAALIDPERPVDVDELMRRFLPEDLDAPGKRSALAKVGFAAAALVLLGVLWRWTPLGDWVTPESLAALAQPMRTSTAGPVIALGTFVAAGILMVPVTALILACGLLFDVEVGASVALAGSLLAAAAGYLLGAVLWRDAVRRLAGERLNALSRRLAQRGAISVAAVRIVPVAPFAVVNMVAGASHIGLRDFLLGTLVGMGPGIVALCLFADRAAAAVSRPGVGTLVGLAALVAVLVGAMLWLRRRIGV